MAKASPAYSLYPDAFDQGTDEMTLAEVGGYIRLLNSQWAKGSVPGDNVQSLSRIMRCPVNEATKVWRTLATKFIDHGGGQWRNARMEAERDKQHVRRERLAANGAKGADQRWADERTADLQEARRKGTHTPAEWAEMLEAYGHRCLKCSSEVIGGNPCKDHVVAIHNGGSDSIQNLQPLCRECNTSKGRRDNTDYRVGHPKTMAKWIAGPLARPSQEDRLPSPSPFLTTPTASTRPPSIIRPRNKNAAFEHPRFDVPQIWHDRRIGGLSDGDRGLSAFYDHLAKYIDRHPGEDTEPRLEWLTRHFNEWVAARQPAASSASDVPGVEETRRRLGLA